MGGRRLVALVLIAVPFVAVVALLTATNDLPSPLPTHWNARGEVDGTMSRAGFTALAVGVTAVAALLPLGFLRAHEDESVRRYAATACALAAYLVGGLSVLTVSLARGASAAAEVDLPLWTVLVTLAVAFAVPAAVYAVWPRPAPVTAPPDPDLPLLDLGPGERAAYVTSLRSRGFVALGIGCGVLGVLLLLVVDLLIGAAVLAVTVAVLTVARVTLRVDETGLRLGFGPGIRVRVPLAEIRQAEVADIRPLAWGGWGYRVMPGKRALVLRAGPGLVLDLRDGTRFAVTVDDPELPAALVNGLLRRQH
jgi:hypothetical protein